VELPVERVLVSHGQPLFRNGNSALTEVLSPPQ